MAIMIVWDQRLKGGVPGGSGINTFCVDGTTPLGGMLTWIGAFSDSSGGIDELRILAHGFENASGEGGYGIQLGNEGIEPWNVQRWSALAGKISNIILFSCGAARIATGSGGGFGDGNVLCSRLAFYTQSYVVASTATQLYSGPGYVWDSTIDFGDWEGTVLTYGPTGAVVNVEYN
jgi:hypothetical protein